MGLFCNITTAARSTKEAVESFHDSKGGKWVAIAMMVGSFCTGGTALVTGYWHHQETMAHLERVDHFNNVQHGSNYVHRVESEVKQ